MNNKTKETTISKASILFYVTAVIFLLIGAFSIYMAYGTIQNYQTQYTLELKDIMNVYFSGAAQYFAYAIISYGIGVILKKFSELNQNLSLCMEDVIEESEEELEEVAEPILSEQSEEIPASKEVKEPRKVKE